MLHRRRISDPRSAGLPTLVVGAGEAGRAIVRALWAAPRYGLAPLGFLDDDPRLRRVLGLPVLGRTSELEDVAARVHARAVLVAIPSLPASTIAELIERASGAGLLVRHLPSFLGSLEPSARRSSVRGVRVEQLLGREQVQVLSDAARALIHRRRVLVTGAGGSIGSELCRQVARCRPAALHLLDHDETNLPALHAEIDAGVSDRCEIVIADIRDRPRLVQVFAAARPELVLHAAAHKHLPLLERHPCEGVKTNVMGTDHLVALASRYGAERFVLISTDKAADPISVLGATKRLAELVVQAAAGGPTRVASVRFGNVLGSRGSLLTILAHQLVKNNAVTMTHPDVTRFFMTVQEAVGLVLEAAAMATGAETFVLDMGEPVPILDLVRRYAAAAHVPDVEIRFTGLRPGEKLTEKIFSDSEIRTRTAHPKVWAARAGTLPADLPVRLAALYALSAVNDEAGTVDLMRRLLPGYDSAGVTRTPATAGTINSP